MRERTAYQVDRVVVQNTSGSTFWKTNRASSCKYHARPAGCACDAYRVRMRRVRVTLHVSFYELDVYSTCTTQNMIFARFGVYFQIRSEFSKRTTGFLSG